MLLLLVLVLIIARLGAEVWLGALNSAEVLRHAQRPPDAVAAIMDGDTYRKSVDYTLTKNRLGRLELIFDAGVLALVLTSGILPWLFGQMASWAPDGACDDALFILFAGFLIGIPSLPFEWIAQFRV